MEKLREALGTLPPGLLILAGHAGEVQTEGSRRVTWSGMLELLEDVPLKEISRELQEALGYVHVCVGLCILCV